jgi:ATP-binding cassette subfamily B protein
MANAANVSATSLRHECGKIVQRMRQVLPIIARRHKVMLIGAMGVMLVNSLLNTSIPVLFGKLVNSVAVAWKEGPEAGSLFPDAGLFLTLIGGIYLTRELLLIGQKYVVENACTRIDRDMTVVVVSHLFKVDLATLARERIGTLQGRISRSIDGFVYFLVLGFTEFLPSLLTIFCALAWVFYEDYRIGLVLLGIIPLFLLIVLRQLNSQNGIRREILRSRENLDGTIVERLAGLEYIRAAHTYRQEVDRVEHVAEEQRQKKIRYQVAMARYDALKALSEGYFHLLVLGLAIYLISVHAVYPLSGKPIQPGDIVMFSLLFYQVINPLKTVSWLIPNVQECSLRVDDLLQLLSEPLDRSFALTSGPSRGLSMMDRVAKLYRNQDLPRPINLKEPSLKKDAPLIVVSNLHVDYPVPGGETRRVLRGVSMNLWQGQTIGAAGPAGSGKSTWLKVLLRLTHLAGGEVFVGGVPLEELSRETIGQMFGYVSQTPFLFAGTIAENIAYGSVGASAEDVRRAAELACIHEEIMGMPAGYETAVTERGQNLSGGQRQRVALARVFLHNPPILILDEGTSALDNINEKAIQQALAQTCADRTTILVAHRLSTLRDADQILVFDRGRIVQVGTFEELEKREGLFRNLVQSAGEHPPVAP